MIRVPSAFALVTSLSEAGGEMNPPIGMIPVSSVHRKA